MNEIMYLIMAVARASGKLPPSRVNSSLLAGCLPVGWIVRHRITEGTAMAGVKTGDAVCSSLVDAGLTLYL